jgi:RimJ/RimL family protein N-acetyltransferase
MRPAWETPPTGASAALAQAIAAAIPVLETARLRLRAMRLDDFDVWAAILCSDRARFMDGPYTRTDAWQEFAITAAFWPLHGYGFWTVADRGSDAALGFAGLNMEASNHEPELGFFLTEAAEGRGIAFEAAGAALGWALTRDLPGLVSYVDPDNARSMRLAEKLGAVRDPVAEAAFAGTDDAGVAVWRHPVKGLS